MTPRMGVDVGKTRIGIAISDSEGIFAHPWKTLIRDYDAQLDIAEIIDKINNDHIYEVFVGLPKTLKGEEKDSAKDARNYASLIEEKLRESVKITMIDERLTTVIAHQKLHENGKKLKKHKDMVDQVAAQEILQQALDRIKFSS